MTRRGRLLVVLVGLLLGAVAGALWRLQSSNDDQRVNMDLGEGPAVLTGRLFG
jgi:hypothetical protein